VDLDLRKVRYFVVVAEELNYGRAARRLHVAQPVLSRQITALERELGVTLFHRSKRGTELTAAGQELVEDARVLLGRAAALRRRARVAGRGLKHITIGFMPGIIVTDVVRRLRDRFADLAVDVLRTGWEEQVDVIHDGRVDVSFVRLPVPSQDLSIVPLYREPRLVALAQGHPLAQQSSVTLADLAMLDLLQPPDALPEWRDAAAARRPGALTDARVGLPIVRTVEEKLEYVAAGRGIVVVPESTAMFYHRADITYRYVDDLGPVETALAHDERRISPELTALVEIAVAVLGAGAHEAAAQPRSAPAGQLPLVREAVPPPAGVHPFEPSLLVDPLEANLEASRLQRTAALLTDPKFGDVGDPGKPVTRPQVPGEHQCRSGSEADSPILAALAVQKDQVRVQVQVGHQQAVDLGEPGAGVVVPPDQGLIA
jgi:DNA-binding transcriptional LysR family regulator